MRQLGITFLLLVFCATATAHPTNPNKSIGATTIAVVTVLDDLVRLELEIGEADRPMFADLVSDGVKPVATEAQQRFFTRGLAIETEDVLEGVVKTLDTRKRVERDPVTGEPLAKPTGTSDKITYVVVEYPLKGKPTRLRLKPPEAKAGRSPNIGLVVYHRSMPVNDFDYFNLRETVSLDWADPWKSKFTGLQFKRYYNAPVWATLTVEPRAVRLEVMCRPNQPPIGDVTVQIDRQVVKPRAEPMRCFRQSVASYKEEKSLAVPDEVRFNCYTFVYPTKSRASDIELSWPSLPPEIAEIPLWINTATMPVKLSDKNRTHVWSSQTKPWDLKFDPTTAPDFYKVRTHWLWVMGLCFAITLFWVLPGIKPFKKWSVRIYMCLLLMFSSCCIFFPMSRVTIDQFELLSDSELKLITRRLLDEAYRAHEAPDEETTYDALADVVSGPLLREAYLSMKQVFDSDQVGHARIRNVTINSVSKLSYTDDAVCRLHCVWTVDVAVIHWGHTHLRSNQYAGELTIKPKDGKWMLTGLDIRDEKQLPASGDAAP
jgi:hypothetical protein